ncbi:3-hydroxyanthranilate 3,4-dioxygenase, isoform CRA_c [Rattus norvegicus]|uniref:3-hydroxyanthranilate 3,4-dioxygenase, isoform CRA_c n=1 Tax=Rattus norvegicus TaxID=10116 RepID=A6H9L3_RAT|nr:3-hydroxyanthranilate 3,4-dioxygenase, isoform CRA_c [Rattus norvegicus]EDM02718.1 3-hydroxyanthranilate 3,4-dioxygenase, isoform CRA_c [Rattus norvegicus]EDM02719.1 3-hydroxyanthranilate 3,4-dioxygenase, isoform CRA_c [Rattus norvegicus]
MTSPWTLTGPLRDRGLSLASTLLSCLAQDAEGIPRTPVVPLSPNSPTLSARCIPSSCACQPNTKKSLNKGLLLNQCLGVLGGRPVLPCHVLLRDTSDHRELERPLGDGRFSLCVQP